VGLVHAAQDYASLGFKTLKPRRLSRCPARTHADCSNPKWLRQSRVSGPIDLDRVGACTMTLSEGEDSCAKLVAQKMTLYNMACSGGVANPGGVGRGADRGRTPLHRTLPLPQGRAKALRAIGPSYTSVKRRVAMPDPRQ